VNSPAAINVSGTGCFFDDPELASILSPWPELTAYFIYRAKSFQGIDRDLMYRRAGASRFGLYPKTNLVRGLARCTIISIYKKITEHPSIVIKEAGSYVLVFYDTTGQNREIRRHIVMTVFPELLEEVRRPCTPPYLITRQVKLFQCGRP